MIPSAHISMLIDRARNRQGLSETCEFLTMSDVMRMTGFTRETVQKMVRTGEMVRPRAMKGHWRWSADTWLYWWISEPRQETGEINEEQLLEEARQPLIDRI